MLLVDTLVEIYNKKIKKKADDLGTARNIADADGGADDPGTSINTETSRNNKQRQSQQQYQLS